MNDKVFESQQELIATQDSFKQAILSEPDVEKHIDIIASYTAKEAELFAKYQDAVEKSIKEKEKEKEKKNDTVNDTVNDAVKYKKSKQNVKK